MSQSKIYSAGDKKKTLTLQEKIRFLAKTNPKIGCRKLAEKFDLPIGKTQAARMVKNEKEIRSEFESFTTGKTKQRNRAGKYQVINKALHRWYKKCEASGTFTLHFYFAFLLLLLILLLLFYSYFYFALLLLLCILFRTLLPSFYGPIVGCVIKTGWNKKLNVPVLG